MTNTLPEELARAAERASRAIPPAWPLASSVAVNPFFGQSDEGLATVAARLSRVAGAPVTMPRSWYHARIAGGVITDADLSGALAGAPAELSAATIEALKAAAALPSPPAVAAPTIADLAAIVSGIGWPELISERFGAWAAGYFDEGQALWRAPCGKSAYAIWRAVAIHDLTPEIIGLSGFAKHVSESQEAASDALADMVERIGLPREALETYFHQMLMTLGGWAQYARYRLWQAERGGGTDTTLTDFLAIRLVWEAALLARYKDQIAAQWMAVTAIHASPVTPTADHVVDCILQEAWERSSQRRLAETLAAPGPAKVDKRPALQAVFCIDVRSEPFRRALESVHPHIQTLGFAGFFGLSASHRRLGSEVQELRFPVLLNSGLTTCSGDAHDADADKAARIKARAKRAWGQFKLAAVSSFAFVEATGPVYAGKLLGDAFGLHAAPASDDPPPRLDPALDLAARINTAETVLRAMSLTTHFAPLVLLVGHGATVVNNPHASGLHCGACGGYSGEVNARLLAALLNDQELRSGLIMRGIVIPENTIFLGALHDTTTDAVKVYFGDHPSDMHSGDLAAASGWLAAAGNLARGERALRLPRAADETSLARRGRDWAEVRPEWALAGCNAFIAAPRRRTAGKRLEGRIFLHDYDWKSDGDFGVLELILTAPVIVASWISLQYYGSTVVPTVFGGGNKLLHNVSGGIGVVEGNGGPLRAGLPWQSVHDGERFIHEPLRLSVYIEAPLEAITDILARHHSVRTLFDKRWLYLFMLDESGRTAWRYAGDLRWTEMDADTDPATRWKEAR